MGRSLRRKSRSLRFQAHTITEKWLITQTTDNANRITEIDEVVSSSKNVVKTFEYEGNGNIRLEYWARTGFTGVYGNTFPDRNIRTWYDDANRLAVRQDTDLTKNTNRENKTTFTYNGDGRRLSQKYQQTDYNSSCSANPVTSYFTKYEYANGEVLNERTGGDAPVWYVRDPQGGLLYTLHWRSGTLKPDAYVRDVLGSIRILLDYAGSTANSYKYDAYGEITSKSSTLRNSYTFTGYAFDDYTGMYYAKARYYRPDLGRFTTQDTWKGSPWTPWTQNLYSYVYNNPVNFVDPTGHVGKAVMDVGPIGTVPGTSVPTGAGGACLTPDENIVGRPGQCGGTYDAANLMITNAAPGLSGAEAGARIDGYADTMAAEIGDVVVYGAPMPGFNANGAHSEAPELSMDMYKGSPPLDFEKVKGQLEKRGWTESMVEDLVNDPTRVEFAVDASWPRGAALPRSERATGFIDRSRNYVVVNNQTGKVVQVNNRYDPGWNSPFE